MVVIFSLPSFQLSVFVCVSSLILYFFFQIIFTWAKSSGFRPISSDDLLGNSLPPLPRARQLQDNNFGCDKFNWTVQRQVDESLIIAQMAWELPAWLLFALAFHTGCSASSMKLFSESCNCEVLPSHCDVNL